MTPTSWLERQGARLAVYDAGGEGMPVVFQHGLCGDAQQTIESFSADPRFRRITLECRGHGASPAGGDPSIGIFADDVAALIGTLANPVVLGGISMGAAIAVRLAVKSPEMVRALLLVRPAWVSAAAPCNLRPNAEVGKLIGGLPPGEARDAFARGETARVLAASSPDNLASLLGFFDRSPHDETARLLQAIAADGPGVSCSELRTLNLPALVCATAEDFIHPLALAGQLAGLIPNARLTQLPPKGRDKPAHIDALHAALTEFLEEL